MSEVKAVLDSVVLSVALEEPYRKWPLNENEIFQILKIVCREKTTIIARLRSFLCVFANPRLPH